MAHVQEPWFREYFLDAVRWTGLVLMVILILTPIVSDVAVTDIAGGYPFAAGMIGLKELFRPRERSGND